MKKFVIELDADKTKVLRQIASELGISSEEVLKAIVDAALNVEAKTEQKIPDERFQELKTRILNKYAGLYERLA
ncbi:MAG: hypothetical protein AAGM67_09370 [Bacteroidota bacterium]